MLKKRWVRVLLILAVVSVLIWLAAVAAWVYFAQRRHPRFDAQRLAALTQVSKAQARFKAEDLDGDGIADYATLGELRALGLVDVHPPGGLDVQPSSKAPTERWWAYAYGQHPTQGWGYFTNHTGAIYTSLHSHAVDGDSCAAPAGMQEYRPGD